MISGQSGKVILNWEDLDQLEAQSQEVQKGLIENGT